mmetsp:Transcript_12534/g.44378  ORF Transcript_12534/g.44378 Transcript_12534/m.44378 type:complete len:173 (+) Transcript_12534:273-791(+)
MHLQPNPCAAMNTCSSACNRHPHLCDRTLAHDDDMHGLHLCDSGRECPQLREFTPVLKPRPDLEKHDPAIVWCERRAREIGAWLKQHPEVTSYVALDDLDFNWADSVRAVGTPHMKPRSVLTNAQHCLTEVGAEEAVRILLNPPHLTEDEQAAAIAEAIRATNEGLMNGELR